MHEVEGEFSSELDKTVVAGFRDYEYGLNL